jgi:pyruvate dehydrogenase E2 component (dihydrolipoamide acetyltransferase)
MAKEVIMPKFGFTQETAEVLAWLKNEGDTVEAGDPIMEVSTDKVSMEVEAPVSGILAGLRYQVGDVVPVTEIIAYILAPGESLPAPVPSASMSPPPTAAEPTRVATSALESDAAKASPIAIRMAQEAGVDLAHIPGSGPRGKITARDVEEFLQAQPTVAGAGGRAQSAQLGKPNAVPAARRIAEQLGVDLSDVSGSGPGGRVQSADVQAYVAALNAATAAAEPPPRAAPVIPLTAEKPVISPAANGEIKERIPFNNMRRIIARNLQKSMQDAPHIYFQRDIDIGAANELIAYANETAADGVKITLTAVLIKAVAWALRRHPLLNSHLSGEELLVMNEVNIGVAVALENGLIVPVIRNADRKGIHEIAVAVAQLGQAAKAGKLGLDDVQGATFTISNLGMFGVDRFTAIINPPQVGILAVGRARKQFVPDEHDQPVLRAVLTLTLSVDHRAIDGAVAARFLADLADALTHLERIIL